MGELLNWEELAVFLSAGGVACWWFALRVPRAPPWGESAALKRALLGLGGLALQGPVAWVVATRPPYVTGAHTVEPFDLGRLLIEYAAVLGLFVGVGLLGRWLE